jgi:hypothetical protein
MEDVLSFSQLSEDTTFQLPAAPLKVFARYLTAGQSVMQRSGKGVSAPAWMIPPRGREISRSGDGPFPAAAVTTGINTLLKRKELSDLSRSQLVAFQRQLEGTVPPAAATRHFPDSDYTVHHRKGFSCDVRTWSNRTENAECVNGMPRISSPSQLDFRISLRLCVYLLDSQRRTSWVRTSPTARRTSWYRATSI